MLDNARYLGATAEAWPELDLSVIDSQRGEVPAVPLELLPQPWRDWIAGTASASGAPADYVFQSVLAGLGGVCGAGVQIQVTPAWSEPLVMWQAAVGESSTGKSAAIAPMRRLLGEIEAERRLADKDRREAHAAEPEKAKDEPFVELQLLAEGADLEAVAEVVSGNPRGLLLWRDGLATWFGAEAEADHVRAAWLEAWAAGAVTVGRGRRKPPRRLEHFPVSVLETIRPPGLKAALQDGDDRMAARFLYVWPQPQPYGAATMARPAADDDALRRLRYLSRLARVPNDPCEVRVDDRGLRALDGVLAALNAERLKADGLEAAWLGRGASAIVRLAGALVLLGKAEAPPVRRPGEIGREQVEAAATLWRDYFRPHARAVFDGATLSNLQARVQRVARWLKETRAAVVSREDIRVRALNRTAMALEMRDVLYRLESLGFLQRAPAERDGPGRPADRWRVNPALRRNMKTAAENADNSEPSTRPLKIKEKLA